MVGTFTPHPAGCLQAWGASPRGPLQEGSGLFTKSLGHTTTAAGQGRHASAQKASCEGIFRLYRVTGRALPCRPRWRRPLCARRAQPASCLGCREPRPGKRQVGLEYRRLLGRPGVHSSWVLTTENRPRFWLASCHPAALATSRRILIPECCEAGVGWPGHLNQRPRAALHGLGQGFQTPSPVCGLQMGRDGRSRDILGKQWKGKDSTQTPSESKPANPLSISLRKLLTLGAQGANLRPPVLPHGQACGSKMIQL